MKISPRTCRLAAVIVAASSVAALFVASAAEAAPVALDPCLSRAGLTACRPDLYLSTMYQRDANGSAISVAAPGQTVVYTMTVGNAGAVWAATEVQVRWLADQHWGILNTFGWRFVSFTADSGFDCHEPGPEMIGEQVWCEGGTIAAGQVAHITITLQAPGDGAHQIGVSLDPDNTIVESNESNNQPCCLTLYT